MCVYVDVLVHAWPGRRNLMVKIKFKFSCMQHDLCHSTPGVAGSSKLQWRPNEIESWWETQLWHFHKSTLARLNGNQRQIERGRETNLDAVGKLPKRRTKSVYWLGKWAGEGRGVQKSPFDPLYLSYVACGLSLVAVLCIMWKWCYLRRRCRWLMRIENNKNAQPQLATNQSSSVCASVCVWEERTMNGSWKQFVYTNRTQFTLREDESKQHWMSRLRPWQMSNAGNGFQLPAGNVTFAFARALIESLRLQL